MNIEEVVAIVSRWRRKPAQLCQTKIYYVDSFVPYEVAIADNAAFRSSNHFEVGLATRNPSFATNNFARSFVPR